MMKKFFIGVDESGITNNHRKYQKYYYQIDNIHPKQEYILIIMVVISQNELEYFIEEIKKLKYKYFQINLKLHTSDLLNQRNKFKHFSLSNIKNFVFELLTLIEEADFKIFYTFVEVKSYYSHYKSEAIDPYFLSLQFCLNNLDLRFAVNPLHLIFESRTTEIDQDIKKKILEEFYWINFEINFINKKTSNPYYGLIELCDFISYFLFLSKINKSFEQFKNVIFFKEENIFLVKLFKKTFYLKIKNSYKKIN